jgi:hypothetical protein
MLLCFMAIWNSFRSFGIIHGRLAYFWYMFLVLVCLDQETSGNPARNRLMEEAIGSTPSLAVSGPSHQSHRLYFKQAPRADSINGTYQSYTFSDYLCKH